MTQPAATTAGVLPPLPDEGFRHVLCVAAHPDDVEYGASAAVAAWTAGGVEVSYLLLTRGQAGKDGSEPGRTAALRTREQVAGGAAVGVSRVDFLDHPDGVLESGLPLRRDVARPSATCDPTSCSSAAGTSSSSPASTRPLTGSPG